MTTVAAFRDAGGRVAIGGDAGWTRGGLRYAAGQKLREFGDLVVAFAGSAYPGHMPDAQYSATVEGVRLFARDLRAMMIEAGHVAVENGTSNVDSAALVVGERFGPYVVDHNGAVVEVHDGYVALGSGSEIAVGAMHRCRTMGVGAGEAVVAALAAAVSHDPFTIGPANVWP